MSSRIFVGLAHYPVYNKNMETITTSVTNLDIHDIARCAATYKVERYYIIHPLAAQHQVVREIIDYWQKGYGASYNQDRKLALELVALRESLEDVLGEIGRNCGGPVYTVVTDARLYPNSLSYRDFRSILAEHGPGGGENKAGDKNYLLLFGTGWGMTKEVVEQADYILEPVYGRGGYNHLSVRSAVAIILDRLLGEKWWE